MSRIRTAVVSALALSLSASAEVPDFSSCIQAMNLQPQGTQENRQKDLVVPTYYNGKPGIFFVSKQGTQFIDLSKYVITKLPAETLPDGTKLPEVKVNPKNGLRVKNFKIEFKVPGTPGGTRTVQLSGSDFRFYPLEGGRIQDPLAFTVRDGSNLPGIYEKASVEPAPTTTAASAVDKFLASAIDRQITNVAEFFPLTPQTLKLVDTVPKRPFHPIGFADPQLYKEYAENGPATLPKVFINILANSKEILADNNRLLVSLQSRVARCNGLGKETADKAFEADLVTSQNIKLNTLIAPKMETLLTATLPTFWQEQTPKVLSDRDALGEATRVFITKAIVQARLKQNQLLLTPPPVQPAQSRMVSSPSTHE